MMKHAGWARALAVTTILIGTALCAPPAQADETTDAPVTHADHVTVDAGSFAEVDLLTNDTDPNGVPLAVCRVTVPDSVPLQIQLEGNPNEPGLVFVASNGVQAGTYEITYYACNFKYLTPGTLTVTVKKVPQTTAHALRGHPGVLKFHNPGAHPVLVLFGGPKQQQPDGRFRLQGGESKRIHVQRHTIVFVAFTRKGSEAGFGFVRHIKLPPGTHPPKHHSASPGTTTTAPASPARLRVWRAAS